MKCKNCNNEFSPLSINQLYCCRKCGDEYRKNHNINIFYPSITFNCSECGKTVITEDGAKDRRTKFCCSSCEKKVLEASSLGKSKHKN